MKTYLDFCNEIESSLQRVLEAPDEYFDCSLSQLENSDLWNSLYAIGIHNIEHSREAVEQLLHYATQMKEAAVKFTQCAVSVSK